MWLMASLACADPAPPPAPLPPEPVAAPPPAPPPLELAAPAPLPAPVVDPGTLPQTEDRPAADDPAFLERMQGVVDAITSGDPASAEAAFFPRTAYLQVKNLPKPEQDYQTRLLAGYTQDLAGLHAAQGQGPGHLVRVEFSDRRTRWVKPGEEYNHLGYFRALGATLVWEVAGVEHRAAVKTFISWRGQWYIVHLVQ